MKDVREAMMVGRNTEGKIIRRPLSPFMLGAGYRFASWLGILILIGFTAALFYHTCNGLRHLAWDSGRGYDLPTMHRTGWLVVGATVVLTAAFWVVGFLIR